ncbi:MAG TPA: S53 family peptidase [Gemmataceae bacterium]|nr:S53 family peptidase [Gemmataceae bacterium]
MPSAVLGTVAAPVHVVLGHAGHAASHQSGAGPGGGYTPSQVRTAYGFNNVPGLNAANYNTTAGQGETIAIVDAYDDPNIVSDLHAFDHKFGLPDPVLTKATPEGAPAANEGWATEIALDVEWAHAMAPAAKILLVEAKDAGYPNLLSAVDYADSQPGVVAVSMSWGGGEFSAETSSSYDGHFVGHAGVTFVAASGDYGAPLWPAISPNVLAVGGTTLHADRLGNYQSEVGWGNGSRSSLSGGSGGGISQFEAKPPYQAGVTQSGTQRTSPDVSYNANPNTGFSVYDSFGSGGWAVVGGTSAGAPQWAALVALADQGRTSPLSTSQVLAALYQHRTDFHDITKGNNGHPAGPGYDLVTGLGSPIANLVVNDLRTA